jgi:hypothetical protein
MRRPGHHNSTHPVQAKTAFVRSANNIVCGTEIATTFRMEILSGLAYPAEDLAGGLAAQTTYFVKTEARYTFTLE